MPWTKRNYPDSMKGLSKTVRDKAIEIANTLIEERNMSEGIAIATAISRAKDWAKNHGKRSENKKGSRVTDVKEHGEDRYVIPQEDGWAIKVEGTKEPEDTFSTKSEAVKQARKEAKEANASLTIQKKNGRVQQRISYNPNKRAKKQR